MPIITLTTDFGLGSPYVAEMKGAILKINPSALIVDITHSIEPQAVQQAAFVFAQSISTFPHDSVHIIVVDPGVGTDRKIICAEIGPWRFVGPDNGVVQLARNKFGKGKIVELTQPKFWREEVTATFHGRDVMAPVAAHLSMGVDMAQLGSSLENLVRLDFPIPTFEGHEIRGEVVWIDNFGNVVTNIDLDALSEIDIQSAKVGFLNQEIEGINRTFGERPLGDLVAYIGSSSCLEIALVNGNLADAYHVSPGESINVIGT